MAGIALNRPAPPDLMSPKLSFPAETRPLPSRRSSEAETTGSRASSGTTKDHVRHKSNCIPSGFTCSKLDRRPNEYAGVSQSNELDATKSTKPSTKADHIKVKEISPSRTRAASSYLTPPLTPMTDTGTIPKGDEQVDLMKYDFSRIDYELDRARLIGKGLWSDVYFAQPVLRSPVQDTLDGPPSNLYAIKVAARPDAAKIFHEEARMLTALQRSGKSHEHIVPFHGFDERKSTLVFESVNGGSLENLVAQLKTMTELERHLELRSLFVKLSNDLINGLHFIHSTGIVHADIKPANVLLDLAPNSTIRARYIDFSASFIAGVESSTDAGGTWDFMAPEQLSRDKKVSTPTFESDIWSLGISLLYILVGASPYAAAVGDNLIRVREAIKVGTPLVYARADPIIQKRMATCQDFVECCRLALQKDIARRPSASAWKAELPETFKSACH